MKKRTLLLGLVLCLILSLAIAGCSVQPSHVHNYSYTVVKEATCEGTGI